MFLILYCSITLCCQKVFGVVHETQVISFLAHLLLKSPSPALERGGFVIQLRLSPLPTLGEASWHPAVIQCFSKVNIPCSIPVLLWFYSIFWTMGTSGVGDYTTSAVPPCNQTLYCTLALLGYCAIIHPGHLLRKLEE